MNEELQKALAESVRLATEGLKQGKDFVVAQAPDVIQQLLRWKFYEAVMWAVALLVAAVALVLITRWSVRGKTSKQLDDIMPMPLFSGGASIMLVVAAVSNAMTAVQIHVAPKIYLIEWAMRQVKK